MNMGSPPLPEADQPDGRARLGPVQGSGAAAPARNVHVLLPVHNRIEITRACLNQLLRQSLRPAQLIVIDDGSSDGTSAMVRAAAPDAVVIHGDGSLWWAGCLQEGVNRLVRERVPGEDLVLMLNDDTTFDDRFIENAVRAMATIRSAMLMAQPYSSRTGKLIEVGVRADWRALRFESVLDIAQANCFSTRGLFIRLQDVLRAGGFRPRFLPHYLSDYEFTIRAWRKGVRLITDPAVNLIVNEEATGQRASDKSSVRAYFRSVVSRRSTSNPFYWTSFLIMACPLRFLLANVLRVWLGFMSGLRDSLLGRGT